MHPLKWAFALAAILLSIGPGNAQTRSNASFPLECASRDAAFVIQLEQRGEAQSMPAERLYAAFVTMLRARDACSEGRKAEALALYDNAFGPVLVQRSQ